MAVKWTSGPSPKHRYLDGLSTITPTIYGNDKVGYRAYIFGVQVCNEVEGHSRFSALAEAQAAVMKTLRSFILTTAAELGVANDALMFVALMHEAAASADDEPMTAAAWITDCDAEIALRSPAAEAAPAEAVPAEQVAA